MNTLYNINSSILYNKIRVILGKKLLNDIILND